MKKYSLLLLATAFTMVSYAQKAVITFETKTYEFGKIAEEDGNATYVFKFSNTGNAPLVVNRVQASCGCTTPTWTKEPIEPGKTGSVTVTYNPVGRPGMFTKTITVYSNASDEQIVLIIKGEVIPKSQSGSSAYPVTIGDLRLKSKVVQVNNVEKGKSMSRVIEIQNAGKSDLKPTLENLPPYLSVSVQPETLKPNQTGNITFTFNSKNTNQWGPVTDEIYVVLNNQRKYSDEFQIRVIGNVVEDFSKLTLDQKQKAPILETKGRTIDFGVVKQNSKKSFRFNLTNKGISALEIRRIINNNAELKVVPAKMTIKSGKAQSLSIDLNAKLLPEGEYKKSITLQTNDPDNSFVILVINWKVQK